MRIKKFTFLALFSLVLFLPRLSAEDEVLFANPETTISMDFQDANLKDILKIFSIQSGSNFIASQAVQDRRVTLYLDKVPIQEAMDKLFKANNLFYDLDKKSNIIIVKDWGAPQIETVTKVFYLKNANVSSAAMETEKASLSESSSASSSGSSSGSSSESSGGSSGSASSGGSESQSGGGGITKAIEKLLSENGSIIEDARTNSLIITDIPSRMSIISQTIEALDIPAPMVMLEVEMLDVSKNVVDKLGFDWTDASSYSINVVSAAKTTAFPLSAFAPQESGKGPFTYGSVGFPTNLNLVFDFLRTQTDTKFLARPKVMTLNNLTAEIKISTDESIGIKATTASTGGSSGSTTQEAERTQTGVILRVTPQINMETGDITMFIYPKVSEAVQGNLLTSGSEEFQYRDPEERSTKSLVRVKDGETVIIGGLIRNEFTENQSKLPFVSNIPILGALFRHRGGDTDKDKKRELLIFITPHIIKDKNVEINKAKNVIVPDREQETLTGFSRQTTISSSLNKFEKTTSK